MEQRQTSYNTSEEYGNFPLFVSHITELMEASVTLFCLSGLLP